MISLGCFPWKPFHLQAPVLLIKLQHLGCLDPALREEEALVQVARPPKE